MRLQSLFFAMALIVTSSVGACAAVVLNSEGGSITVSVTEDIQFLINTSTGTASFRGFALTNVAVPDLPEGGPTAFSNPRWLLNGNEEWSLNYAAHRAEFTLPAGDVQAGDLALEGFDAGFRFSTVADGDSITLVAGTYRTNIDFDITTNTTPAGVFGYSNDGTRLTQIVAVPEPGGLSIVVAAFLSLSCLRYRHQRTQIRLAHPG
ncbi:MAG: hypothetical protein IT422_25460 [Pirellulaceae bacterium]|nr:hypothetical protein [Pirellulaceae bacterium]